MSLMASIAFAALASVSTGPDPDGVISTAPGTVVILEAQPTELPDPGPVVQDPEAPAHGMTTDQQIARWVAQRSGQAQSWLDADADDESSTDETRKMHGTVFGAIGTGGYQAVGASVLLPIGEEGWLGLSFMQGRNAPWGYGYEDGGWADDQRQPDASIELRQPRNLPPMGSHRRGQRP